MVALPVPQTPLVSSESSEGATTFAEEEGRGEVVATRRGALAPLPHTHLTYFTPKSPQSPTQATRRIASMVSAKAEVQSED